MSQYLPRAAVLHELSQQAKRRSHGLLDGTYLKYPNGDTEDHFVVKRSKLYAADGQLHAKGIQLKERMDRYVAQMTLFRAEQKAKSVARGEKKDEK